MPPKTPDELREKIEQQSVEETQPAHERTAEGLEVETPKRGDFFGNLKKVSRGVASSTDQADASAQ